MSRWEQLRLLNWSDNTWKTYRSRWASYHKFCQDYGFVSLPASLECVCVYITYLCQSLSYGSITKYVNAVWIWHEYNNVEHINRNAFMLKATLSGAKRLLGDQTRQVDPLLPEDILGIRKVLDMSVWADFTFWVALILSYRCLLRVGHVTSSNHTLKVSDVMLTKSGMDIIVRSSKTIQFKERVNRIPVVKANSKLCPVEKIFQSECRAANAREPYK